MIAANNPLTVLCTVPLTINNNVQTKQLELRLMVDG